jgi:putative transposase
MSRPLRIEFPHALYHVTSRGDRREDIYLNDADRQAWLTVLAQVCQRFHWTVYAYCLMDNHYHLLVQTPDANLSAGMRQLNGVYTQLVNRAHGRVGHVFQGRFKAILVDQDNYLLELARYVVLNPVRAGRVKEVKDWPWSSYGVMLAPAAPPGLEWLAIDALLAYFAPDQGLLDRKAAQKRYLQHVREGMGLPSVWEALSGQIYLGDAKFVDRMSALAAQQVSNPGSGTGRSRLEIPQAQRRPRPVALEVYARKHPKDRDAAIRAAFAGGGYTMAQLAEHFKLHYTSVSRIVKAV